MNESMLDRLKTMENRYEELGHMLMDPDIGSDIKKMTEVTKEQSSLQAAYDLYQEYKEVEAGISDAKELAKEIESITLEFTLKSGKDGKTFGSVSTKQVVEQLREKYGIKIDKRKFIDAHPIGALGYTKLKVDLYKGIIATINVHLKER